nr:MAG TPA: hypothetical protein [Caudoviricetes sp.]
MRLPRFSDILSLPDEVHHQTEYPLYDLLCYTEV